MIVPSVIEADVPTPLKMMTLATIRIILAPKTESVPREPDVSTPKEPIAGEPDVFTPKESIGREPTSEVPMVHKQIDILPPDKHTDEEQEEPMYHSEELPDPSNEYAFTQFWFIYPRKVSKKPARRVFDYLVSKQGVAPELIIEGAKRYAAQTAAERTPQQYIKYPNMWLEDERWEDEIVDPVLDKLNTSPHPLTDMVRESLRRKAMDTLTPNGTSKRLLQ